MVTAARQNLGDVARFALLLVPLYLVILAVDLIWLRYSPIAVDFGGLRLSLVVAVLTAILATALWLHPLTSRIGKTLYYFAVSLAYPFALLLLSELLLARGRPLIDPQLAAWDHWLGFDWVGYQAFIAAHPALKLLLRIIYETPFAQVVLLLATFGFCGQFDAAGRLVSNLMVTAIIISIIGGFYPALGAFSYYLQNDPTGIGGLTQALVEGQTVLAKWSDFKGAVTFPSDHTAMSVIFVLVAWCNRFLRWPILALNAVLVVGIPYHGSHFLVDMIAGAMIAVAVDFAVRAIDRRKRGSPAALQVPA